MNKEEKEFLRNKVIEEYQTMIQSLSTNPSLYKLGLYDFCYTINPFPINQTIFKG